MYVDCALLLLSIYTEVTCKLHPNPLSNLEQIMRPTLKFNNYPHKLDGVEQRLSGFHNRLPLRYGSHYDSL